MRALFLATAVTAAAVVAGPASAHPTFHYEGDCGFTTVSDGSDSPSTRWDGAIHAAVVATEAATGAPAPVDVHVECILYVNGANPTSVLSASGTALAVGASDLSFTADPDDVVTLCPAVTVGTDYHFDCDNYPGGTPVLPEPVQDLLAQVWNVAGEAGHLVDEKVCSLLAQLSHSPANQPPLFEVRSDGDVYVAGAWFWDCPPYGSSGS